MPSPFERNPGPGTHTPAPLADSVERSLDRTEQERRVWVARSFTSLIVFGLVVLGVILVRRDRLIQTRWVESLSQYATVLNEKLDKQRKEHWDQLMLPAEWDVTHLKPKPTISFEFYRYYDDTLRQFAQTRSEPTLIAWSEQPVAMMLSSDGRAVAIYEKGHVRVEWLKESEYTRRFDEQQDELEATIRKAERQPPASP